MKLHIISKWLNKKKKNIYRWTLFWRVQLWSGVWFFPARALSILKGRSWRQPCLLRKGHPRWRIWMSSELPGLSPHQCSHPYCNGYLLVKKISNLTGVDLRTHNSQFTSEIANWRAYNTRMFETLWKLMWQMLSNT